MRYSYEFKKECVELYKQGKWMETPEGVKQHMFRDKIRYWNKLVDFHGEEILKNKEWSAEEKFKHILKFLIIVSYLSMIFYYTLDKMVRRD